LKPDIGAYDNLPVLFCFSSCFARLHGGLGENVGLFPCLYLQNWRSSVCFWVRLLRFVRASTAFWQCCGPSFALFLFVTPLREMFVHVETVSRSLSAELIVQLSEIFIFESVLACKLISAHTTMFQCSVALVDSFARLHGGLGESVGLFPCLYLQNWRSSVCFWVRLLRFVRASTAFWQCCGPSFALFLFGTPLREMFVHVETVSRSIGSLPILLRKSSFLVKSRPAVPRHLTRNVTPLSKTPPACWMQTIPKLLNAARSSVVASLVHSSTCAVVTLSRKHATYLVASVVATLFFKILVCSDWHCALIMMAEAEAVAVPLAEPKTMAITTADKKLNTFEAEWEIRCIVCVCNFTSSRETSPDGGDVRRESANTY
jgi:hypothetical protein